MFGIWTAALSQKKKKKKHSFKSPNPTFQEKLEGSKAMNRRAELGPKSRHFELVLLLQILLLGS